MDVEVSAAVKDILSAKTLDEFDAKVKRHGGEGLEVYPQEANVILAHRLHLACQECQQEEPGKGVNIPDYIRCVLKHQEKYRKKKIGDI